MVVEVWTNDSDGIIGAERRRCCSHIGSDGSGGAKIMW